MFEITNRTFKKEVLDSDLPVLVDFWAQWCMPCQAATPVLEDLAKEYEGKMKFTKLNVDEAPDLAQRHQIISIPTVVIFKEGEEVKRQVGFPGKKGYKKLLEEALG